LAEAPAIPFPPPIANPRRFTAPQILCLLELISAEPGYLLELFRAAIK